MMPYLFPSQVPELCGFNRLQRRFLIQAAERLLRRDDPWFLPLMQLLQIINSTLCIFFVAPVWPLLRGSSYYIVTVLMTAMLLVPLTVIYQHILCSHLRPYLKEALRKHSEEVDEIA